MTKPLVYIIIINWNGYRDTAACLESVKKILYTNYKIIVIDNASKNNEGQILKEKFGDYIHLIQNDQNYGFAEGNNIGIKYALKNNADYVLLLNNDTVIEKNFLIELVYTAQQDKKNGIVSAKSLVYNTNKIWFGGGAIDWKHNKVIHFNYYESDNRKDNNQQEINFANACCVLIKSEILKNAGLFDKRFFYFFEDVDLSHRIKKNGYKIIYNPKAIIWHKKKTSIDNQPSTYEVYYSLRNKLLFFSENNSFINKVKLYLELFFCTIPGAFLSFRNFKIQNKEFQHNSLSAIYDFLFKKFGIRNLK